jgi:hypothetical protein
MISSPSRIEPTAGLRRCQPKRSAAVVMASGRWLLDHGRLLLSSRVDRLSWRNAKGSMPIASAISSTADSGANSPGAAPGARIDVGVPRWTALLLCVTSTLGHAYRLFVMPPHASV